MRANIAASDDLRRGVRDSACHRALASAGGRPATDFQRALGSRRHAGSAHLPPRLGPCLLGDNRAPARIWRPRCTRRPTTPSISRAPVLGTRPNAVAISRRRGGSLKRRSSWSLSNVLRGARSCRRRARTPCARAGSRWNARAAQRQGIRSVVRTTMPDSTPTPWPGCVRRRGTVIRVPAATLLVVCLASPNERADHRNLSRSRAVRPATATRRRSSCPFGRRTRWRRPRFIETSTGSATTCGSQ